MPERDPERIDEVIDNLRALWKSHPNQRLGQLLENYVFYNGKRGDSTSCSLFYQEDDATLTNIKRGVAPKAISLGNPNERRLETE